jgi:hypothetical protein
MQFGPEQVRHNVRQATTEDLLDRVTVYRGGMEPEAVTIIEGELQDRGVYRDRIDAHAARREREGFLLENGIAVSCSFCRDPAVRQGWGWHWLQLSIRGQKRRIVPLVPRLFRYCARHRPAAGPTT